ncbi:MAG: pilus assembly protein N-terminal domain-containing protein [Parvularculaceae bacterium]
MRSFIIGLAFSAVAISTAHAEQIWLTMDQVRPYDFKKEVGQIVVGNPGIADVSVRDKSHVLLFGKAPGLTNLFLFDDDGNPLDNILVRVRASNAEMLTVQRGSDRATYNCTSVCEPTLTVGDSKDVFQSVRTQVQQKYQQASGSGSAPTAEE